MDWSRHLDDGRRLVTQPLSETPTVMNPIGDRMLHRDYLTQAKDNSTRASNVRGR